ncbi:hypothetical protein ACFXOD_11645 [Streptomyces sp. NPDC059161]|uniref:hypothetical protein n=1 Tax=Streptomyces sp. NPDC059161 TaxID=3346749 RepID=UPI0036AAD7C9
MNVNDLVQQRIEAARRKIQADRARRAQLAAARRRSLAARHSQKLFNLHSRDGNAGVGCQPAAEGQIPTVQPERRATPWKPL